MARITVVGLGPAGLDRLSPEALRLVTDPERTVLVRTLEHPAAVQLAERRLVESGDAFYASLDTFDDVYAAIGERLVDLAEHGDVVYAVPGSARIGERSVPAVQRMSAARGVEVQIVAGESFLDVVLERIGVDPIADGLQVVDGRELPDPMPLHLPTVITQVDTPVVLADVTARLGKVLPSTTIVIVLANLGDATERVEHHAIDHVPVEAAGPRTSLFLDPPAVGWHGLVATNRRLREECPWDAQQTHHSLLSHLVEEAYETVEALTALPADAPGGEPDFVAYAGAEEELGDLLLQVVFHSTLAREAGAFDVEEVAEGIRRKLVRRHPHVFGDVEVAGAAEVLANWEELKAAEKSRESLMDDIPTALPAIARADKMQRRAATAGFDWPERGPVLEKVREEVDELADALDDAPRAGHEVGDLLFAVVNLARHLHVDPEIALRQAVDRFEQRFRLMEAEGSLAGLTLAELDARWERAKAAEDAPPG